MAKAKMGKLVKFIQQFDRSRGLVHYMGYELCAIGLYAQSLGKDSDEVADKLLAQAGAAGGVYGDIMDYLNCQSPETMGECADDINKIIMKYAKRASVKEEPSVNWPLSSCWPLPTGPSQG